MLKRPSFFLWYYNEAIHDLLEIWKNFLLFVWRYFSLGELFVTLFSPWHRDISIDSRRGFNPLHFLEILFENLISRFIGAIVRTFVILTGLILLGGVFLIGIIISLFWICAPLAFVGILVLISKGQFGVGFGFLILGWILLAGSCYWHATEISFLEMNIAELLKQKVFERICGRLGLARKDFPVEILENQAMLTDFLKARSLTLEEYKQILAIELGSLQNKKETAKFWDWSQLRKKIPLGAQWRFGYTVNLDRYSQDLAQHDFSQYAKKELLGRSSEGELLKLMLSRPDQNCVLVVGNAGIGKKTLIHNLAREIRSGQAEGHFENTRVVLFDLSAAISDAVNHGRDLESFLSGIFYEATVAGNVILVIEHLEHYLGGQDNLLHPDIASVLSQFLALPAFRLIATSTSGEYHQLIEKKQEIVKYFETLELGEPTEKETIQIMWRQLEEYEQKQIIFSYSALKAIVSSSTKHNWSAPLPERALDLMMDVLMFWNKEPQEQFISEKTVSRYLSLKTGVQQGEIGSVERKKLLNLEKVLHRQVIGQQKAVSQVAEALRRSRSGIGNSQKPIGSFLFLGPTGVGKTETAKALAKVYFGSEKNIIRLDMSEFQTPNSLDRILGSSQLNQPGRLVTQIKDNPYSLLLLDEIEKAYPDILDIFLQILDEGFVTDAFGEKINFRNCLIIATSNAGAVLIKKMVSSQAPVGDIKTAVVDEAVARGIFKLEFLNRFDDIIFFRPLEPQELTGVVRLKLQQFAERLDKEKNIQIEFAEDLVEKIIQKGYDPVFGARSLNRYIEDTVENLVAKEIISGGAKNGEPIKIRL